MDSHETIAILIIFGCPNICSEATYENYVMILQTI